MLEAVSKIDFSKLKYGVKLYFTYDEEIGFSGIYDIIDKKEKFPEIMIFGEPTYNKMLVGSKGLLEYELKFKGIKAHSSNPSKGISANLNAVKFINELDEFYNNNIRDYEEESYEVPYTTMNVGTINGGSAKNSVSANCEVAVDFRIANKNHINIIKDKMEKLSEKYDCDINLIKEIEPFIDKCEFAKEIKTANFMTEASFVNGATRIILGAGPVTAHEVNEYITEESYNKLVEQYKELILKACN
ncbi:MAG: M20/M25/M40 family metallo-hydrolase [Clostridia bacterium]|nr:M20/M25/M40 family metallo-hydrolase [Clostridia bacterium]